MRLTIDGQRILAHCDACKAVVQIVALPIPPMVVRAALPGMDVDADTLHNLPGSYICPNHSLTGTIENDSQENDDAEADPHGV